MTRGELKLLSHNLMTGMLKLKNKLPEAELRFNQRRGGGG